MIEIQSVEQFDALLGEGPLVADFYTVWCGPCRNLQQMLGEFEKERPEVRIVKVNIEKVPELGMRFNVSAVPTMKFFRDSLVVEQSIGAISKATLERKVESLY